MVKRFLFGMAILSIVGCGSSNGLPLAPIGGGSPPGVPPAIAEVIGRPMYASAVWGLRVEDAQSGEVLVNLRPDYPFFIGSVRKIFSVGLLLNEVGAEHTYDTPVFRQGLVDGAGVLDGDLVLVASGDLTMGGRRNPDGSLEVPDFDHNEANSLGNAVLPVADPLAGFRQLAAQVAAAGITRVTGEVVIDDRLFVPFNFRDEFDVRPIFVNDNVVDLSLRPTTPGSAATVEVRPLSSALTIVSTLLTGAAGSELMLESDPEFPTDIGAPGATSELSGNLPIDFEPQFTGQFPLVRTVRITQPSNYARTVFVEALEAEGVMVDAPTVEPNPTGALPAPGSYSVADRVALLRGARYGELARWILKVSYNIGADTSLVLYGLTQGVNTMAASLVSERQVLTTDYGLDGDEFTFVDGSGGGPTTASNETVTRMLARLLASPQAAAFFNALPILGVDGSLASFTEYTADPTLVGATGQVRAKTGTFAEGTAEGLVVRGQAFGGVIDTRGGRRLVYQLVVNEVPIEDLDGLLQIFEDQATISAILWRDY
jgi:D-alanyl-D-alanine carboxypeptidase